MRNHPVSEANHGLAMQTDPNKLSIRICPDGLSYARMKDGSPETGHLSFEPKNREEELARILESSEWANGEYPEVSVCLSSAGAVFVPDEADLPECREILLKTAGIQPEPGNRILALPYGKKTMLLVAVDGQCLVLLEKYFEKSVLSYHHPLSVNFSLQEEKETLLQIDTMEGMGYFTLSSGHMLLFADAFPLETESSLLFMVNQILASNAGDTYRIVCSGDRCDSYADGLKRYYPDVCVHPDGEDRDLLFPLR